MPSVNPVQAPTYNVSFDASVCDENVATCPTQTAEMKVGYPSLAFLVRGGIAATAAVAPMLPTRLEAVRMWWMQVSISFAFNLPPSVLTWGARLGFLPSMSLPALASPTTAVRSIESVPAVAWTLARSIIGNTEFEKSFARALQTDPSRVIQILNNPALNLEIRNALSWLTIRLAQGGKNMILDEGANGSLNVLRYLIALYRASYPQMSAQAIAEKISVHPELFRILFPAYQLHSTTTGLLVAP